MQIGIIGLPNSGKSTIYNALTRSESATRAFSNGKLEVHTTAVAVPDPRVHVLSEMFMPRKTTYAQVIFNDIAGIELGTAKVGFNGPLLNAIAANDALMLVVRAFEDEQVPHPEGSVDPTRDIATLETELILSDMTIVDRRIERLRGGKNRRSAAEKSGDVREENLLHRLLGLLENEVALRDAGLSASERQQIGGYGLLSLKPLIRVINVSEENPEQFATLADCKTLTVCGRLEEEIACMNPDESAGFLAEFGIEEPSLHRAIRLSYQLLGLESFFTVGEDEVRAWTIRKGMSAPQAAGVIHSDLQKGFIRAETIAYDTLVGMGTLAEARKQGRLRLEGKDYVVTDGDIMNIRFNV